LICLVNQPNLDFMYQNYIFFYPEPYVNSKGLENLYIGFLFLLLKYTLEYDKNIIIRQMPGYNHITVSIYGSINIFD